MKVEVETTAKKQIEVGQTRTALSVHSGLVMVLAMIHAVSIQPDRRLARRCRMFGVLSLAINNLVSQAHVAAVNKACVVAKLLIKLNGDFCRVNFFQRRAAFN